LLRDVTDRVAYVPDEFRRVSSQLILYAPYVLFRVSDFIAGLRVSYALEELRVSQFVFHALEELRVSYPGVFPGFVGLPHLPDGFDRVEQPVLSRHLEDRRWLSSALADEPTPIKQLHIARGLTAPRGI
jgi:hypothetical protein